jgi:hypothetical protein
MVCCAISIVDCHEDLRSLAISLLILSADQLLEVRSFRNVRLCRYWERFSDCMMGAPR